MVPKAELLFIIFRNALSDNASIINKGARARMKNWSFKLIVFLLVCIFCFPGIASAARQKGNEEYRTFMAVTTGVLTILMLSGIAYFYERKNKRQSPSGVAKDSGPKMIMLRAVIPEERNRRIQITAPVSGEISHILSESNRSVRNKDRIAIILSDDKMEQYCIFADEAIQTEKIFATIGQKVRKGDQLMIIQRPVS